MEVKEKHLNIQSGKHFSVSTDERGLVASDPAGRKYRRICRDCTAVLFQIEDIELFKFYSIPGLGTFLDQEDFKFIKKKLQQRRNGKII